MYIVSQQRIWTLFETHIVHVELGMKKSLCIWSSFKWNALTCTHNALKKLIIDRNRSHSKFLIFKNFLALLEVEKLPPSRSSIRKQRIKSDHNNPHASIKDLWLHFYILYFVYIQYIHIFIVILDIFLHTLVPQPYKKGNKHIHFQVQKSL